MEFESTIKAINLYNKCLREIYAKEDSKDDRPTEDDWSPADYFDFTLAESILKDSNEDFAIQVARHILSHCNKELR